MCSIDWGEGPSFAAIAAGQGGLSLVRFHGSQVVDRVTCPIPELILGSQLQLILGSPVVGHGPRPSAALGQGGGPEPRWIDTLLLARAVWPEEPDHALPALARRLGIPWAEDALSQAEATGRLFLAALDAAGAFPPSAQALLAELLPHQDWLRPRPSPPRPLPPGPAPTDVDEAFKILTQNGSLSPRPAQLAYAREVEGVLARGGIALLEAGPGTGKTFGYLIPLLLALSEGEDRAVVATRTRTLQEQLWRRDLPFLREKLGAEVSCALLKGRENYVCLRRLEEARRALFPRDVLLPLLVWAERTATGDLEELAALSALPEGRELLRTLPDTPERCGGRSCPFWGRCPSRRAREKARAARLVVVNHALLGADLARALLGPYTFLVVDEAHAFSEALRDALSQSLSPAVIPRLLGEIRRGEGGLLAGWEELGDTGEVLRAWEGAVAAHRSFWAAASAAFPEEKRRYGLEDVAPLLPLGQALAQTLDDLAAAQLRLARDLPEEEAALAQGLAAEAQRLGVLVRSLLHPQRENTVFWYAREPQGLTLAATPVDVGEELARGLWPSLKAGILTSATLAAGDGAAGLARELGLGPAEFFFRAWPSPFPYDQVRAFVLRYLPHPDDPGYPEMLARSLRAALAAASRRALALFTSRRLLLSTAAHLGDLPHLAQGRDGERDQLLTLFRRHPPPVLLLGLESFWEGIDLPGEELEILLVARLPFPVPTDPVAEAESEKIAAQRGSPFSDLFLPRAVLRLRQGIGRLVRTPTDRGVLLLADPRLVTRPYGDAFLRALPVPAEEIEDPERLAVALRAFFR